MAQFGRPKIGDEENALGRPVSLLPGIRDQHNEELQDALTESRPGGPPSIFYIALAMQAHIAKAANLISPIPDALP